MYIVYFVYLRLFLLYFFIFKTNNDIRILIILFVISFKAEGNYRRLIHLLYNREKVKSPVILSDLLKVTELDEECLREITHQFHVLGVYSINLCCDRLSHSFPWVMGEILCS